MNSDGSGGGSVPGELAQASRDPREPFTHLPPGFTISIQFSERGRIRFRISEEMSDPVWISKFKLPLKSIEIPMIK